MGRSQPHRDIILDLGSVLGFCNTDDVPGSSHSSHIISSHPGTLSLRPPTSREGCPRAGTAQWLESASRQSLEPGWVLRVPYVQFLATANIAARDILVIVLYI